LALSAAACARRLPPPPGLPRSAEKQSRSAMEAARAELDLLCALLCVVPPSSLGRICTASPTCSPARSPPTMGGHRPLRSSSAGRRLAVGVGPDRPHSGVATERAWSSGERSDDFGLHLPKSLYRERDIRAKLLPKVFCVGLWHSFAQNSARSYWQSS
jgi:hypothetical protein